MKIELIRFNDEGTITYWVRVDDSFTHPKSAIFYKLGEAEDCYNDLIVQHKEKAKEIILKTTTI